MWLAKLTTTLQRVKELKNATNFQANTFLNFHWLIIFVFKTYNYKQTLLYNCRQHKRNAHFFQ